MREVDLRGVAAEVGLGGSAGTESANGEEVIIRGCEVEDLLAFDERLLDDGVDAEGVAVEDNEVGVFAGFERADAVVEFEDLGVVECEGFERTLAGHAAADSEGGGPQKETRVGDVIVGMEANEHAGFFEHGSRAPGDVPGFEFATGAVEHDEGTGDTGRGDFIGDLPAIAHVLQHNVKAEFTFESKDGENVVVAMGVVLNGAAAGEDFPEGLETEVTGGQFFWIISGGDDLFLVFLRGDEGFAHESGGLGAAARELGILGLFERVGAVGHFDSAGHAAVRKGDQHAFDRVGITEFGVDGLAGDEVTRARHEVGGGDAAGLSSLDGGVAGVDAVESTQPRLNGFGVVRVESGPAADVGMGIDEAGHDCFAGHVDLGRVDWDRNICGGSDCGYSAIFDDENSFGNRIARDGDQLCADVGGGFAEGGGSTEQAAKQIAKSRG